MSDVYVRECKWVGEWSKWVNDSMPNTLLQLFCLVIEVLEPVVDWIKYIKMVDTISQEQTVFPLLNKSVT